MQAFTASNSLNTLDWIYVQTLNIAIPPNSSPDILSLAILLQTDPNDVKVSLVHLQSVIFLAEPEDTPRIYHKSFSDFITDAERCSHDPRFHISIGTQHAFIARNCFRVMDEQLHPNICDLKFPERYLNNHEIQHLLKDRIPPELQYACLYWAIHLSNAEKDDNLSSLLERFSFAHLLHWLEVLSLMGRLDVGYIALDSAMKFTVGRFTRT